MHPKNTLEDRFWAKVQNSDDPHGCWLWIGSHRMDGYGIIKDNKRQRLAHRVCWELTHGPIPAGLCVCHVCDNPPCVNPAHLWLGTPTENAKDRNAKGRTARGDQTGPRKYPEHRPRGEAHYRARLTDERVREIRIRAAAGEMQKIIAEDFGIWQSTVSSVVRRATWKHVRD